MSDEQMTTNDNPVQEESNTVLGSGSDNQDWKSTLPEDLKNDATLQNFKNVEDLAKTVVHQQKRLGNTITMPKTDDEMEQVYTKLGRPEDPSKYNVTIPEDYQPFFEEKNLDEFKNVAHKIGLNDKQVGALLEYQMNTIKHEEENEPAEISRQKSETESVLKQEWGYDYDKKVAAADRALKVYGDDELRDLITNSSAGNNPAVIRFFARLGQEVTEDMAQNTQNNRLSVSPLDAKDEIAKIMSDANHAYHKGDETAVEKVRQLHEKAYGN
tara:strand:+ start:1446 stop:2255 length:810 start_codon:yes stop_codon:yes gene_type:complete